MARSESPRLKPVVNTGVSYETAAESYFRRQIKGAKVQRNVKVPGLRDTEQIDVLITTQVGRYIITMGVEAKDYARKLDKDRFASIELKFKSARVDKGIILCAHGVQSGVLERIRTSEVGFELEVLTLDQLIDGIWSSDFLKAVPLLRSAKTTSQISDELIQDVVLAIEKRPAYARYFFHGLTNCAWASALARSGFLERCFLPGSVVNTRIVSEFISRCSDVAPDAFIQFVTAFNPPDGWIEDDLLLGALKLDDQNRTRFIDIMARWKNFSLIGTDRVSELVEREFLTGRPAQGLKLLDAVTRVDELFPDQLGEHVLTTLRSPLDVHWFADLTTTLFPKLAVIQPQLTLEFARQKLIHLCSIEKHCTSGDLPTWVRHNVGDDGEFGILSLLDAQLVGYRDTLLQVTKSDAGAVVREGRTVLADENMAAIRCVVFVLAKHFDSLRPLFSTLVEMPHLWAHPSLLPELEVLLDSCWELLSEVQKVTICNLLLNLPIRSSRNRETNERTAKLHDIAIVQWLVILIELGVPNEIADVVQSRYEVLATITGISARQQRIQPLAFWANSTPAEAESFAALEAEDILRFCQEFKSYSVGWDEKTPRGVAEKLAAEIKRRPDEFLRLEALIASLPFPAYHEAAIEALTEALAQQPDELDIEAVLRVVHNISELGYSATDEAELRIGSKDAVVRDLAYLIRQIAASGELLNCSRVSSLHMLWKKLYICSQENTNPATWSDGDSHYSETLNSTDGALSIGLCALSTAALKLSNSEDLPAAEKAVLISFYHEIRTDLLEAVIKSPYPRVRSSLGQQLTALWYWDKEFFDVHYDLIFPNDMRLLTATLEGHFHVSQRHVGAFRYLTSVYDRAVELLACDESCKSWKHGFARDVVIFFWAGEIVASAPLLNRFLALTDSDTLCAAMHWVAQRVQNHRTDEEWAKAISFWAMVLEVRRDLAGGVFNRCLHVLAEAPPSVRAEDVREIIEASLTAENQTFAGHGFKFLQERAESEPNTVAELLVLAAKHGNSFFSTTAAASMKEATKICFRNGNSSAKKSALDVERQMLLRGAMNFEGTVSGLKSASNSKKPTARQIR